MTELKELKVEDIRKNAEEKGCPVQRALYYVTEFLAGPMCARCFPCAMGNYEAKIRLQRLAEGKGTEADVLTLRRIAEDTLESSMCKKGKDTARFIIDWMVSGVFQEHAEGRCPEAGCPAYIEYRIIAANCTMCGLCKEACRHGAIIGEKVKPYQSGYLPYEIRQKRCVKCGECIKVCPSGAIVIVEAGAGKPAGV